MDLRCGGEAELEGFWSTWTFVVGDVGSALSLEVLRDLLWNKIKHLQCFREELTYHATQYGELLLDLIGGGGGIGFAPRNN
eukprot:6225284-Amphidinium_carterae.1